MKYYHKNVKQLQKRGNRYFSLCMVDIQIGVDDATDIVREFINKYWGKLSLLIADDAIIVVDLNTTQIYSAFYWVYLLY